jgi:hypothetical protein
MAECHPTDASDRSTKNGKRACSGSRACTTKPTAPISMTLKNVRHRLELVDHHQDQCELT